MREEKQYCIYILTNPNHTVLYTGMTSKLADRIQQHKMKLVKGFTEKYNVNKLVYYEVYDTAEGAITREKQIKAGPRKKKEKMINKMNPKWEDLSDKVR
ncbi:MAG: GIY-YIG nuclease family protein [bacterium]|nr:GIY-YIG nuclease family protein [bacterium]